MKDPGVSKKHMITQVKAKVNSHAEYSNHWQACPYTSCPSIRSKTDWEFSERAAQNWSKAMLSLPEGCFKFALNSVTETLPHNSVLFKWKML